MTALRQANDWLVWVLSLQLHDRFVAKATRMFIKRLADILNQLLTYN